VGLEASGSAHHWARELMALGHEARMMPPAYVKPYIRRQRNDGSDAAAICEAVTRPSMRFVAVRLLENQAALMRHKGTVKANKYRPFSASNPAERGGDSSAKTAKL